MQSWYGLWRGGLAEFVTRQPFPAIPVGPREVGSMSQVLGYESSEAATQRNSEYKMELKQENY